MHLKISATLCVLLAAFFPIEAAESQPTHVKIFSQPGRFGGWPANHGIWSWGDEILVGFSEGTYQDMGTRHHINRNEPEYHRLARSLDGGLTWKVEEPKNFLVPEGKSLHGKELPGVTKPAWRPLSEKIQFDHPGLALTFRMIDVDRGPSRFAYSYDRGHSWEGPFSFPNMDTGGIAARTDYVVTGPSECLAFLTAAKSNRSEGRTLLAVTSDGGLTWTRRAWIGEEPDDGYAIMPSGVRVSEKELYVAVRRKGGNKHRIEGYYSPDLGSTWEKRPDPVGETGKGNPPSLIRLRDGRLCLTYGVRAAPNRICARLSSDAGKTWTPEITLRQDGSSSDLGYPRSVQRADGKVLVIYYFSDIKTGPERYVAATIWQP